MKHPLEVIEDNKRFAEEKLQRLLGQANVQEAFKSWINVLYYQLAMQKLEMFNKKDKDQAVREWTQISGREYVITEMEFMITPTERIEDDPTE